MVDGTEQRGRGVVEDATGGCGVSTRGPLEQLRDDADVRAQPVAARAVDAAAARTPTRRVAASAVERRTSGLRVGHVICQQNNDSSPSSTLKLEPSTVSSDGGPPENRRRLQATAGDCKKPQGNYKIY